MTIFLSSPIFINRLLKQICAKTLQTFALAILWRVLDWHSFNDKNVAKMVNLVKDLQIEIYLYGKMDDYMWTEPEGYFMYSEILLALFC